MTDEERIAQAFHDAYGRLAPRYGYDTRLDSSVPWEQVPFDSRRLMCAVVGELLERELIRPAETVG